MTPQSRSAGVALAWSFGNTIGSKLGGLAIGIVLARLLGPEAFGTYAVAFIALMAILAFNDLGVSLAIVRWPDEPELIAPTVNTVSIVSSVLLTGGVMLAAGPFAGAMGDPSAAPLVRLLALSIVLNGVVATPAAVLQRGFRSDLRTAADQVNIWLGAIVSLSMALLGAGAIALVVGRLAGSVVSGGMLLRFSPIHYRLGLEPAVLRRLLGFGLPLAGASLVVFGIGFIDQIVVGHELGAQMLGFYVLAFNLASWPVQVFSQPLRQVAPAVLARQQHDPRRMRTTFTEMVPPLAAVALPSCVLLAVAAPEVISFVYGQAWQAAAEPLRWLAVFAAARILSELAYDFVVVAGSSRSLLWVQLAWLAALGPAVYLGVRTGGLAGGAIAQVVVSCVVVLPAYGALLHHLGIEVQTVLRALGPAALVSLALVGTVLLVRATGAGPLELLVLSGVTGAAGMGLLLYRSRHLVATWRASSEPEPVSTS